MIGPIRNGHPHEWPIVMIWYTKHAGQTIERIIDSDIPYFEWMVQKFQLVTPQQAEYYKLRTNQEIPQEYIKDVTPYQWQKGDPDELYMHLCQTGDLKGTLDKFRNINKQLDLF